MHEQELISPRFQSIVSELVSASGFSLDFPEEVLEQVSKIPLRLSSKERNEPLRRDLRALPFVTIDDEDAKDFDDAVYIEKRGEGFRLWVAISDLTHYVPEGSALDECALQRATSVYLTFRVLPMFPERLSNHICSLLPGEEKLCLVVEMVLDAQGRFLDTEIYPAVIQSAARLTYEAVQAFFDGNPSQQLLPFLPMLENARTLASRLRALRTQRGVLEVQLAGRRLEYDAQGEPQGVRLCFPKESHGLVELFMVCANEAVARYATRRALPVLFRCHGTPDEKKLLILSNVAKFMGLSMGKPSPHAFNRLLSLVHGKPEERFFGQLLLRAMKQAVYSEKNEGHYGLASLAYLHFTSPIRRYPDLWVHRVLKAHWANTLLPADTTTLAWLATHCLERERLAIQLEREVVARGGAYLAEKHLGEVFQATVVGFARVGCFLELEGLWTEGLIPMKQFGKQAFFDEKNHCLRLPNRRILQVGMRCTVCICSVHLEQSRVRLKCLSPLEELGREPKRSKNPQNPPQARNEDEDI
ncbi:MAG: RNB domain-containing ribonuclease [Cystobacterineae bacterium]|nr:RNB domain-containing ribonuclease [Cystobacterineae bacterium]